MTRPESSCFVGVFIPQNDFVSPAQHVGRVPFELVYQPRYIWNAQSQAASKQEHEVRCMRPPNYRMVVLTLGSLNLAPSGCSCIRPLY